MLLAVENSAHCDFVKLRNMLVRTHMQDLKDVTRETHYENYRAHCIQSMTRMVVKERNRKYALEASALQMQRQLALRFACLDRSRRCRRRRSREMYISIRQRQTNMATTLETFSPVSPNTNTAPANGSH